VLKSKYGGWRGLERRCHKTLAFGGGICVKLVWDVVFKMV